MSSAFTKHYARMMDTGMDLKADLERLSERVRLGQEQDHNESNTVGNLVLPLIAALGYDTQDIAEVEREYSVAGGSVDIIVKINDATAMIFECKRVSTDLDDANVGRLHGYFGKIPEASIGILTNGAEYQFFGNRSSTSNEMSMQPFLEIDLGDGVDDEEVDILRCFSRAMFFEPARAMEDAGYSRNIVSYLRRQMFEEPMDREFISLLAKQSGSNRQRWTDQDRQDFEPRIKRIELCGNSLTSWLPTKWKAIVILLRRWLGKRSSVISFEAWLARQRCTETRASNTAPYSWTRVVRAVSGCAGCTSKTPAPYKFNWQTMKTSLFPSTPSTISSVTKTASGKAPLLQLICIAASSLSE